MNISVEKPSRYCPLCGAHLIDSDPLLETVYPPAGITLQALPYWAVEFLALRLEKRIELHMEVRHSRRYRLWRRWRWNRLILCRWILA